MSTQAQLWRSLIGGSGGGWDLLQMLLLLLGMLLLLGSHARAGGHHIGDVLLAQTHLLDAVGRKEAGLIGAAHIALEQTAVRAAHHFDHIARLEADVTHGVAHIWFHAHHRGAGMPNGTGCRVRVCSHARRVADDVAGVAQGFVCFGGGRKG